MKVISCLIDFTDTSKLAYSYAKSFARKENAQLNLLHIVRESKYDVQAVEQKALDFVGEDSSSVSVSIGDGNYLEQIPKLLEVSQSDRVVIGSHGKKGALQTMVGADVVQLIQKIEIPAFIVQGHSPASTGSFSKVLFPIGPHSNFHIKIEATAKWAQDYGASVDVLILENPQTANPAEIDQNVEATMAYFNDHNIAYTVTRQPTKVYGVGYGKAIMEYAEGKGFDVLSIMSETSEENMYFGNVDKTDLILNTSGLPVLCII